MDKQSRIFIVGCSRSGTTLLQSLLSAHPQHYSLRETSFFQLMIGDSERRLFGDEARVQSFSRECRRKLRMQMRISSTNILTILNQIAQNEGRPDLCKRNTKRYVTYQQAVSHYVALLDSIASEKHCGAWIEKTPSHVHFLHEINEYCQDAKIVHIIRDGKEVAASMRVAGEKYPDAHWSKLYDTTERIVARWNKAIRDSIAWKEHQNHYFIRYDWLIKNPHAIMRALSERLELAFDMKYMDNREIEAQGIVGVNEPWKSEAGMPVRSDERKRFEVVFNEQEKLFISDRIAELDQLNINFIEGHE